MIFLVDHVQNPELDVQQIPRYAVTTREIAMQTLCLHEVRLPLCCASMPDAYVF